MGKYVKRRDNLIKRKELVTLLNATNCLTPLFQAVAIKHVTSQVGFDFVDVKSAVLKLEEEMNELKEAIENEDKENIFEEAGDVLFVLANVANKAGFNIEQALEASNKKFIRRFKYVVEKMKKENIPMTKENVGNVYEFWEVAKNEA